ncbi:MBL fold metallo-hydrolase [Streptomyces hokutonensis]|uniref:MBL fold metallo-hydrolase n=1 Tax=Streptomyces hokutonensis TaxID=1306990 RepID=UPI0033F59DE0
MDSFSLGDVEVTRVVEFETATRPPAVMFPDIGPRVWDDNRSWLAPDHWDPDAGLLMTRMQTFVLRSGGATILVDTGVGNDKSRPATPAFDHRDTDFLARPAAVGVRPEDVDVVVNTHLPADHVGWNTRLVAGSWAPTFPNARHRRARTYAYEFAWRSPAFGGALGACHCVELPFVFHRTDLPALYGDTALLGPRRPPPGLADRTHAAWTAFIRDGDPAWTPYDLAARATVVIDERWSMISGGGDQGAGSRAVPSTPGP